MQIKLSSSSISDGGMIPVEYTCEGDDLSPPLAWGDPPPETKSFALLMDDPDAPMGTWVHWLIYNLPAEMRSLPQAMALDAQLNDGTLQGSNSWKRTGYGGPCPPGGSTHRYFFRLYALDTILDLAPGVDQKTLVDAMKGHVLATGELMGSFGR